MTTEHDRSVDMPVTERGRATRQALLDAAEEVFGEVAFDRASVSEITRRAGVAQGTFYVHFPDKSAVFVQLVENLNRGLRQHISSAVANLDDRLETERAGLEAFFEYTASHRALYKVVREAEFVDESIYRWHYETLAASYISGLKRAMVEGQINPGMSPETLAWTLMGIGELLGSRWVILEHQQPPTEVLDEVMAFIGRGMGHCDEEVTT